MPFAWLRFVSWDWVTSRHAGRQACWRTPDFKCSAWTSTPTSSRAGTPRGRAWKKRNLSTLVSAAVNSGNLVAALNPEPIRDVHHLRSDTRERREKCRLSALCAEPRARSCRASAKARLSFSNRPRPSERRAASSAKSCAKAASNPDAIFDLCYCPERVLPGNTVAELVNNDRIVGGITPDSARRAESIYARFCQGKISLTDDQTAEMCKLMENTYRDVNIALCRTSSPASPKTPASTRGARSSSRVCIRA